MSFFSKVETWQIPESALNESFREMARDGEFGNEGVALWLGKRAHGIAVINRVVILRSSGVVRQPDLLVIPQYAINEVTDVAMELGLVLVGQIHSHGKLYGTDLSSTDRTYGISVPFYLSVVAPDFALRPKTEIRECGVHVFEADSGFHRLSQSEVEQRIRIDSQTVVPVTIVGDRK